MRRSYAQHPPACARVTPQRSLRLGARLGIRLLAALLACGLSLLATAPGAHAEDETPLARLSVEERAILEQRIPGLGSLPREKQDLIVRNVERLRGLSAEQRKVMERRLKAAREAGLGGQDLAERGRTWGGMSEPRRALADLQGRVMKALGWRAWNELPAELRAHPAVAPLLMREWSPAFFQRFVRRAAQSLDVEQARAWLPSERMPSAWREGFLKDRTRLLGSTEPERALLDLRKLVLQGQALEAVHDALSAPVSGSEAPGARLAQAGERLRALAEPAFVETLADFKRLAAEKGPEAFAAQLREMGKPPQPPPELQRKVEALQVVAAVEAWGPFLARHPALEGAADTLLRAALVDDLGMPVATFQALPGREAGAEARAKALRAWFEETGPRELRKHLFQRRGLGERGPPWWGERGPGGWRRGADLPKGNGPDKPDNK